MARRWPLVSTRRNSCAVITGGISAAVGWAMTELPMSRKVARTPPTRPDTRLTMTRARGFAFNMNTPFSEIPRLWSWEGSPPSARVTKLRITKGVFDRLPDAPLCGLILSRLQHAQLLIGICPMPCDAVRVIAVPQRIAVGAPFTEFAPTGLRPGAVVWRTDLFDPTLLILPEPLVKGGGPCLALPILRRGAAEDEKERARSEGDNGELQTPVHINRASCHSAWSTLPWDMR